MRVTTDSELWDNIYYNLRDHYIDDPDWVGHVKYPGHTGYPLAALLDEFRSHGIHIIQDDSTGKWTDVDLPDGEALIELILRWS